MSMDMMNKNMDGRSLLWCLDIMLLLCCSSVDDEDDEDANSGDDDMSVCPATNTQ